MLLFVKFLCVDVTNILNFTFVYDIISMCHFRYEEREKETKKHIYVISHIRYTR